CMPIIVKPLSSAARGKAKRAGRHTNKYQIRLSHFSNSAYPTESMLSDRALALRFRLPQFVGLYQHVCRHNLKDRLTVVLNVVRQPLSMSITYIPTKVLPGLVCRLPIQQEDVPACGHQVEPTVRVEIL